MEFDGRAATVNLRQAQVSLSENEDYIQKTTYIKVSRAGVRFRPLRETKEDFFMAVRQAQAIVRGVESMPIYTKTGDGGQTGLFSGKRVSKASLRIEAIGTVDELNSVIGLTISLTADREIKKELIEIQKDLFVIGGALANPLQKVKLLERTKEFENQIDKMTKKLPPLFNFILPGGGIGGSTLHIARTVCRRTERRIVELSKKEKVQSDIVIYINRLSDLFLTMSRFINHLEKKEEIIWKA